MILKKIQRSLLLLAVLFFVLSPALLSFAQESTLTPKEKTEILDQADSILDELRTMRGQPPPRPVHKEFKSKEQLRDLLARYSQEEHHLASARTRLPGDSATVS